MDRLARTLRPSAGFEDRAKDAVPLGGGTDGPGGLRTAGARAGAPWGEARTPASASQARLAPALPGRRARRYPAARFAAHVCLARGDAGVVAADCRAPAGPYRVDDDAALRASGAGPGAAGDRAGGGGAQEGAGGLEQEHLPHIIDEKLGTVTEIRDGRPGDLNAVRIIIEKV